MTEKQHILLVLPWPPSVNHYWVSSGKRRFVSARGREYRDSVRSIVSDEEIGCVLLCELSITIDAFPPDRRRRDIDNILKSPLDALQHGGVYADDYQITKLLIRRCEIVPGGMLSVTIKPIREEKRWK